MVTVAPISAPEPISGTEYNEFAAIVQFAVGTPLVQGYSWVLYGSKINKENVEEWSSSQEVQNSKFNFDITDRYHLDGYVLQGQVKFN
jgi:hypothetical protein